MSASAALLVATKPTQEPATVPNAVTTAGANLSEISGTESASAMEAMTAFVSAPSVSAAGSACLYSGAADWLFSGRID